MRILESVSIIRKIYNGLLYNFICLSTTFHLILIMIEVIQSIFNYTYDFIYLFVNLFRLGLLISYHIGETAYNTVFGIEEKSVVDEIVLITEAGHGVGKELALQYARLGAIVVCLGTNQQLLEDMEKEIKKIIKRKNAVFAYQCDIFNREEIFQVFQRIIKDVGDVTILINNASIMPCHGFLNYTSEEITRIFDINILSYIWMVKTCLPSMIRKNCGHIVAVSSLAGLTGIPNVVPYSASKFAVAGFMDALSSELAEKSQGNSLINFTTVYPFMEHERSKLNKRLPFVFPASSEEIAAQIIKAQRTNIKEISVPLYWTYFIATAKLLPAKSTERIRNFLNIGVEADD